MDGIKIISMEELAITVKANDGVQIVNVIEPPQFHLGKIRGTMMIPLSQLDMSLDSLDKDREVITYSADHNCPKARQAAERLAREGFNVRIYDGGIKEWKDFHLPSQPAPSDGSFR